jgi:predicted aspartyl protease
MSVRFRSLVAAAVLAPALIAQTAPADFHTRLEAIQEVMNRFYRGENLATTRTRVNAEVDAFNAATTKANHEADAARAKAEAAMAAARDAAAQVETMDRALAARENPGDRESIRARNSAVERYNQLQASAQAAVSACNGQIRAIDASLDQARAQVAAHRDALKARSDAYDAFRRQDRDVAFFSAVNGLLADLRQALRQRPDPALQSDLDQVRRCRRELAEWAMTRENGQDDGLVLVLAEVADEVCCFIVDTGAQQVCLPMEIVEALGLGPQLGEVSTMTLAGGQKVSGRALTLPRLAASGQAAADVPACAIPASEVGIDGLLGQTFLKHFAYTIDERRPEKLVLVPR